MGFAWALLLPMLTISAGLIIRMAVIGSGGAAPSLAGITIKSWGWAFFAGAMNFATMSLLANISLVTKIWFPREVLPLASVLAQVVDSAVGFAVIAILLPFLGVTLGWPMLWFPVIILLLIALTTGLAYLFACANIFFRDVKYILQVILTFGIIFTPVMLETRQFGRFASVVMLNPLAPLLEGMRLALIDHHNLAHRLVVDDRLLWSPWWLGYSAIWAILGLWVGMKLFRNASGRFAEAY